MSRWIVALVAALCVTSASAAAKRPPKKEPSADAAKLRQVSRAKSTFMFAVETCARPDRCDAALLESAQTKFMDACTACAPAERCEQEREAIQKAEAKASTNPCRQ
jgi:hypothetical protein